MTIDNGAAEWEIQDIKYKINQEFQLQVGKHTWSKKMTLCDKKFEGCPVGEKKQLECEVNLAEISKDDMIPSCKVNLIKCRHIQQIYFNYDGTCMCHEMPNMEFPIIISKNAPKPFYGFIPPPPTQFSQYPQPLGNCRLEVPPYKQAKKK